MDHGERLGQLITWTRALPPEAAAAQVRLFFDGLDPVTAFRLADEHREDVGELEGAPAPLRYHANNLRLLAACHGLGAKVAARRGTLDDVERLATLEDMLTPVHALIRDASGRSMRIERPRQFLSLDVHGDGKAVEVIGDLATADTVSVLVPGMGNSLETLRDQAARGRAIHREAGSETNATVVWLGYDAPDNLRQAISKKYAYAAAPALRAFSAGLATEIRPDALRTLIGHSYGSVVAVYGLRHGASFDNLILTGSPGLGHRFHSLKDLDLSKVRCYVFRAPGDPVAYSQWHGTDPVSIEGFERLATAGGVPVFYHQQYYRPGSESLRNTGCVIRGEYDELTMVDTSTERETRLLIPGLAWGPPLRAVAAPVALAYDGIVSLTGVREPPRPELVVPRRGERVSPPPQGRSR